MSDILNFRDKKLPELKEICRSDPQRYRGFSKLKKEDSLLIFSVGGGNLEKEVSVNIVKSLQYAEEIGSSICGIVGRDGGYTAQIADACVVIPPIDSDNITPHTEGFQALVWHLLVSHPDLQQFEMKWESVK